MSQMSQKSQESVSIQVDVTTPEWEMRTKVTVPAGPTRLRQMLPLVQALSDRIVDATTRAVESHGDKISCQKGCGACCRHLVFISEMEARHIRDVIERLPEPRRTLVRLRFGQARTRLEKAGLIDSLLHPEKWTQQVYQALANRYFQQQVACPFLEEESCSIHPDRPITCREYLVTSPAAHCADPTRNPIKRVRLPVRIFNALARSDEPSTGQFLEAGIPLILAPEWAEAHPEDPPPRPGPELLRSLLKNMRNQE